MIDRLRDDKLLAVNQPAAAASASNKTNIPKTASKAKPKIITIAHSGANNIRHSTFTRPTALNRISKTHTTKASGINPIAIKINIYFSWEISGDLNSEVQHPHIG